MSQNAPFTSRKENYSRNLDVGNSLRVVPGRMRHEDGITPGVAVFNRDALVFVITEEHAYKLANGIADALEQNGGAA